VPFTATLGKDGDPLGLNSVDSRNFPNGLTGQGCASLTNPGNPNHYIKAQCFAVPTAPSADSTRQIVTSPSALLPNASIRAETPDVMFFIGQRYTRPREVCEKTYDRSNAGEATFIVSTVVALVLAGSGLTLTYI
jgi:hypothetical protein